MKTGTKITLIGLGGLAAFTGGWLWVQFRKLVNGIKEAFARKPDIILDSLSLDNISLILVYLVKNEGWLSANVYDQSYKVYVNKAEVAQINNKGSLFINSKKTNKGVTQLGLKVNFSPRNIVDVGIRNLGILLDENQWDKFQIDIVGSLKYRAGALSGTTPIKVGFTLADVTKKADRRF